MCGKEQAKLRKQEGKLKLLDPCKTHGGPVGKTSIQILEDFTLKHLQIGTRYLKNKIAPNLKIKHRSDVNPVTKNYKMISVSAEHLKKNIKEVIVPTLDQIHSNDNDTLIKDVIFK